MTATYTTSLRLTLQGDGDNPTTWGDVTNNQVIELIEAGICGVAQVTVTGSSDVNIAATTENGAPDTARNMVLQLVGTLGANINLIVPAVPKVYFIDCQFSGGYTVTVVPVGGAPLGLILNSGQQVIAYVSGTTITLMSENGGTGALLAANNLSDLTSVSDALTNLGLGDMATQSSNSVNITGGSITGVTGLSAVTSVAGRTGAVTLSNTDISGLGTLATQNGTAVVISTNKAVVGAVTFQWGVYSSGSSNPTITYPTAFSGAPTCVLTTSQSPNSWNVKVAGTPTSTSFATQTFSLSGTTEIVPFSWFAIGPT